MVTNSTGLSSSTVLAILFFFLLEALQLLHMRGIVHIRNEGAAVSEYERANGCWRNDNALEVIKMHTQIMGDSHFNQIGVENQRNHIIWVFLGERFNDIDYPILRFPHCLAIREIGAAWIFLNHIPHFSMA